MRWEDGAVTGFRNHLTRVGLHKCPVCSTGMLDVSPAPVVLPWRGFAWRDVGERGYDTKANILFMLKVTCDFCAHVMLFDSERFSSGDDPVLRPE